MVSELQPSLFNALVIVLETRAPSLLAPNSGRLKAEEEVKASSTVSDTLCLRVYITKAQEMCGSVGYPSHLIPSLCLPTSTVDWQHLVPVHMGEKFDFYTFPHLDCSGALPVLPPSATPPNKQSFCFSQVLSP